MSEFERLLELSDLDIHSDQLAHRRANDPVHAAVSEAESAVAALDAEIAELEARRHEIRRAQSRLEDEVALLEEKKARFNAQLYDGTVVAHKDLEALQTEIAHLGELMSGIEDGVIEQMELAEPVDADLDRCRERRAELDSIREGLAGELTILCAEIDAELATSAERRSALVDAIDAELVSTYESMRSRLVPAAARLAAGGRCEGCHLTLPRAQYDALKRAPADEMIVCPECGRILVR